jgi:hypothetical protein
MTDTTKSKQTSAAEAMKDQQEQMVRETTRMVSAVTESAAEFVSGSLRVCSDLAIGISSSLLRVPAAAMQGNMCTDSEGRGVPGMIGKAIGDTADVVRRSSERFTESFKSSAKNE